MAGNILLKYASATQTISTTNLVDADADGSLLSGWSSDSIDNYTNQYADYLISGTFTTESTARQIGRICVYICTPYNGDSGTYPALSAGTMGVQSATLQTFNEAYKRDAACRLLANIPVSGTASAIYTLAPSSVAQLYGGVMPTDFCIWITSDCTSSGDWCAAGSLYYTPIEYQYT